MSKKDTQLSEQEELKKIQEEQYKEYVAEPEEILADAPEEVEAVKEPEPIIEREPQIDIDKIKQELKDEVSTEVAERVSKALKGDETKDERDRYEVIAEEFAQKNGRSPAWHELVPYMVEDAKQAIKAEQAEEARIANEQQQTVAKTEKEREDGFNKFVDDELTELYANNRLPKIKDKEDPEDYGVRTRTALFQKMMEVNQKRVANNEPPIYSINKIFHEHFTPPSKQPAGANAPISAGRGGNQAVDTDDFSYHDIHNKKSILDFFR